jgi:AcrR family transcriptional regulator
MAATSTSPALVAEPAPTSKPAQILAAAKIIFMEQGFGAASMDAIAREAGVSKATLYSHFAGKEQLFAAMVTAECRAHAISLSEPIIDRLDVTDALYQLGRAYVSLTLSPTALAIYRVVVAEVPRLPNLGRIFFESGPALVRQRLTGYLQSAAARGLLRIAEPAVAAEHFIGMVHTRYHLRALLQVGPGPSEREVEQHVRTVVALFCRAYAAEP